MKEIILCKYGEIVLKGANRPHFEALLSRELKRRAKKHGNFYIHTAQSTVFIEPKDDLADIDGMYDSASKVFGLVGICRAAVCEKNMDSIKAIAKEYLADKFDGAKTFKVEAKRSDKQFPLKSPEISAELGGEILTMLPRLKVDVKNPDVTVRCEIRETNAYIHANQDKAAGGIPVGSSGKGLLMLSGGIDSPVAGYMMAKRGMIVDMLHFESFPYTSERALEKVLTLADIISDYTTRARVTVISLTEIQEELKEKCEEDYFTLLLRRFMMYIAGRMAIEFGCKAIITGESLGQVASQTSDAIAVTDAISPVPVYRPCIGMDKEEIVQISRKIGAFDTSILPYEDCCTVFTPRHPRTRPELHKLLAEEAKVDFMALAEKAIKTRKICQLGEEPYFPNN